MNSKRFDNKKSSNHSTNTIEERKEVSKLQKKSIIRKVWDWFTESRNRIISVIFLVLFAIFIITLGALGKDPTVIMLSIVYWFKDRTGNLGLYLGVGVISTFGNMLVFLPSMYAVVLMFVAVLDVNPWILGIAAGIGASIGQIVSWFIGRATREIVDDNMMKRLHKAQKWIDRGLAPFLIFLFAATPLPDEVLLITIGLVNYSLWKTLIFCFFGKITLTLICSVLANILSTTNFGKWVLDLLFNLTPEMLVNNQLPGESNVWTSIAVWLISATLIIVGGFIDWVGIIDKWRCKQEEKILQDILELTHKTKQDTRATIFNLNKLDPTVSKGYFPENSLWLFEREINKNRKTILRKSLISISAVVDTEINITIDKDWMQKLRVKLDKNDNLQFTRDLTKLVKHPENMPSIGLLISNLKLISYKIPLKALILDYNLFNKSNLSRRERKRILRKTISFEILINSNQNEHSEILAINLKEGVYLRKIEKPPSLQSIKYWLILFERLLENTSKVKNLHFDDIELINDQREITFQPEMLDSCPI